MRIAYNEATCRERSSLEGDLCLCRKYGVKEIELRFDMIERYLACHSVKEFQGLFRDSGVRPITLNAIFNINFLTEVRRRDIAEQMRRAGQIGRWIGANCVIVLPSDGEATGRHAWPSIREDSIQNLRWLAQIGATDGMRVAFEPIGAKERCVRSISAAWEIVRAVAREDVGLALDAYNLYMYDGLRDVNDIAQIDPKKVFIVHLDDADANIPYGRLGTFDRKLPGDGSIDLKTFVAQFEALGYEGPYSIEILNQQYWQRTPEALFHEALEKTRKLMKDLERERRV